MITDINSEDRLVQETFANHLETELGWENVFAWNQETFGQTGTLGRESTKDVVLKPHLEAALRKFNPEAPDHAIAEALEKLTRVDFSRSMLQHNEEFYRWCRDGVPVTVRSDEGQTEHPDLRVIDFERPEENRFVAVRELKVTGLRAPEYNRRADIVCFVNGLPLVFIELKAVYLNIRQGYDGNISDYKDTIPHVFHHNAFLIVSNGDRAKYGSITSEWPHFYEWKRQKEEEEGDVDARVLLNGMLAKERLLDLFENFILFDGSRSGGVRKVVARNHQWMGVNKAVGSVERQQELKKRYPPDKRLVYSEEPPRENLALLDQAEAAPKAKPEKYLRLAHKDLGRLGVFWHTQGSGKSYSMLFFAEKVRRRVAGDFTFVLMTDRTDLDDQIYKTFTGCGAAEQIHPRVSKGSEMEKVLQGNHRYVFSLIHKFNQPVDPNKPYSKRDDIIVISDEAHRTQGGRLARNMRLALPNASFIGFTGTPLFKQDELTRRIFGSYVSRYDFKRSEQDGATVKLLYENRGEKLGLTTTELNDSIAERIDMADLSPEEEMRLENLLGKDYEIITADERLWQIAEDFVEHASMRWQAGKALFVCIDKVTCGRLYEMIIPLWQRKIDQLRMELRELDRYRMRRRETRDQPEDPKKRQQIDRLKDQIAWMETTIISIVMSESQGEVGEFRKWGMDVVPHRALIKQGFEDAAGETVAMDDAFKDPEHPFRIGIVCAMWLTGFDVECLSTLYLDKPLKAHTLMQAIARANRVFPGKACGVIVDYNGMLKSLRKAMATYALGEDEGGTGSDGESNPEEDEEILPPIGDLMNDLREAIELTEAHLAGLGFDVKRLEGVKGFDKIQVLRDATNALFASDEARKRFEIMARAVISRFNALITERAAYKFAKRRDNIETILHKLHRERDLADVHAALQELHRVVNQAIGTRVEDSQDHPASKVYDLSKIDLEKLRDEFATTPRKNTAVQEIRSLVEEKLRQMLARNPLRMDFNAKYQEIIAEYNREKDRVTIEQTFEQLTDLMAAMTEEDARAAREGLEEDELAVFDLMQKERLTKADRERVKQASRELLAELRRILSGVKGWNEKEATRAEVETTILDHVYRELGESYSSDDKQSIAKSVYDHLFQQSLAGKFPNAAA